LAVCAWTTLACATLRPCAAQEGQARILPAGVQVVWDLAQAHRESTATRERVCINGLWRWQPARDAAEAADAPPADGWGFFKVPGSWPGLTDYMQKDSQTLFVHPAWRDVRLAGLTAAWYEREITIPADWDGRRIMLSAEYLNSLAFRRVSCLTTRLLANLGTAANTPVLEHFHRPVDPSKDEKRWLKGLYLDVPEEWDDPYRFFRW
jgi:hypothetical protein